MYVSLPIQMCDQQDVGNPVEGVLLSLWVLYRYVPSMVIFCEGLQLWMKLEHLMSQITGASKQ